jgi:hypothetical protein
LTVCQAQGYPVGLAERFEILALLCNGPSWPAPARCDRASIFSIPVARDQAPRPKADDAHLASARAVLLLRRCWYCGRVMIHNQPTSIAIPVGKAKSRRTTNWLASGVKSRTGKGIGSSVDSHVAMDANTLLPQNALVIWRSGRQEGEVLTNAGRIVSNRGRRGTPQHRLRVIEGENSLLIVATHGINPSPCRRGNLLLCDIVTTCGRRTSR